MYICILYVYMHIYIQKNKIDNLFNIYKIYEYNI